MQRAAQVSVFCSGILDVAALETGVARAFLDFVSLPVRAPTLVVPLAVQAFRFHFAVPVFAAPLAAVSVSVPVPSQVGVAPLDAASVSLPVPFQVEVAPLDAASVSPPAVALVVAVPFSAHPDVAALSAFVLAADPISFAAPSVLLVSF